MSMTMKIMNPMYLSCRIGIKYFIQERLPSSLFSLGKFARCIHNGNREKSFRVLSDDPVDDDTVNRNKNHYKTYIDTYSKQEQLAKAGGGEKAILRHTETQKKLLANDRLKLLLDNEDDFLELCLGAGLGMPYGDVPRAGIITGVGRVHGRLCMIIVNDATVKGGTIYPVSLKKQLRVQEIAEQNKLPTYYVVESGGGFLPLQADIFTLGGRTFHNEAVMSSKGIPQLAIVCGNCTAGGAYIPTMAEEAIMIHKHGYIFLGGPPLVKAATGELVSAEDLGGATLHCSVSGCADYFAENEEEAFSLGRDIAATLTPHGNCTKDSDPPLYDANDIPGLISPDNDVNIYKVISRVTDGSRFGEFKQKFGSSLVTGFSFIHGCLVGIVGNNGAITEAAGDKGAHFIQICCERNIPLVFLQNSKEQFNQQESGESIGNRLRAHAKMLSAVSCASVPVITFIIGNSIGPTSYLMGGRSISPNFLFTWPNAVICMEDPNNLINAIIQEKLASQSLSEEDISKLKSKEAERIRLESSSFYAASRVWNDGIVLPQDTRKVIRQCLEIVNAYRQVSQPTAQVIRM